MSDTSSRPPAGWYHDPTGQGDARYWNGSAWTESISRGGVTFRMPVPAQQRYVPPVPGSQYRAPTPAAVPPAPAVPPPTRAGASSASMLGVLAAAAGVLILAVLVIVMLTGGDDDTDEPPTTTDAPAATEPPPPEPTEAPTDDTPDESG